MTASRSLGLSCMAGIFDPGLKVSGFEIQSRRVLAVSGAAPQTVKTTNTTVKVDSSTTVYWNVDYVSTAIRADVQRASAALVQQMGLVV